MAKKKELKMTKEELFTAILLSCGPPPTYASSATHDYATRLSEYAVKFTQCVTAAGGDKCVVGVYMRRYERWHRAALERIERAENLVSESLPKK